MKHRRSLSLIEWVGWTLSALAMSPHTALAAACCGGTVAIPALITGYERFRFGTSVSGSRVIGDAPEAGVPIFRKSSDRIESGLMSISAAAKVDDRLQFGASLTASTDGAGIGDGHLIAAFEIRRREDTTSLAPQVHVFTQLTLPLGRSMYETQDPRMADVTGSGFWRASVGAAAVTTYRKWDGYGLLRGTAGLPREFDGDNGGATRLHVSPGLSGDLALGGGYSFSGDWRAGLGLQASFAESRRIESPDRETSLSGSTLVWPVQAQLTYFHDTNSMFTVTYSDETLIGPVKNTTLSRTIALQYSYRWAN